MKAVLLCFLLLTCLLAAASCGSVLPNPTPASSLPPSIPTAHRTPEPSPSPFTQRPAQATPSPSPAAFASPTTTATLLPLLSPTPVPPGAALFKKPGAFPIIVSTDGRWLALLEESPDGFWYTHFVKADASQEWLIRFDPSEFASQNFDYVYLAPFLWLPKEPYVFLNGIYSGPCGWETFTLRRLNLKTGQMTTLIPGSVCSPATSYYSISNTGRYLLSTRTGLSEIHLQRLSDGVASAIKVPFRFTSAMVMAWSPDETRAILTACQIRKDAPSSCSAAPVFWLDAENGVFHHLVPDLNDLYRSNSDQWDQVTWLSANRISLHLLSGTTWEANLVTGQLICRSAPCQAPRK